MTHLDQVTVSLAESAIADLQEIRFWYVDQGIANTGDRIISEIFHRIEQLATYPELGRVVPEFNQPFLRELIQPPFRIVYRHDPGQIHIVRIWRSERLLELPEKS